MFAGFYINQRYPSRQVLVPDHERTALIEALEDHDDVNAVHANFDVDAAALERVAAA